MLLQNLINYEFLKRILTGISLSIVIFWSLLFYPKVFSLIIFLVLFLILKIEWPLLCPKYIKNSVYYYLFTLLYIILPFLLIIYLEFYNYFLNFYLFISVFSHDTFSYIFGKLFGRSKLLPKVSPNKTIEGAIGGFVGVSLISYLFFQFNIFKENFIFLFIISLLITVTALLGDLFESYLKRLSDIKDSGSILPGHGGLLDRFDSILFNVYLIYFFKDYLM